MVDWEVTATTIFCDSVRDEVTIIIKEDGSVKCSGRLKYNTQIKKNKNSSKKMSKADSNQIVCLGVDCVTVKQQRAKVLGEK
jgi:hypothetical protein